MLLFGGIKYQFSPLKINQNTVFFHSLFHQRILGKINLALIQWKYVGRLIPIIRTSIRGGTRV